MEPITKRQIKDIYTLGGNLGIVERGSHDDGLHQLVAGITGKEGVSQLTTVEAGQVLAELLQRMRLGSQAAPIRQKPKKHPTSQGGMTEGQQRKVWHLMYQLAALDVVRSKTPLGERLCGIIRQKFGVDSAAKEPMAWLTYAQGGELIEIVKCYLASAEQKRMRGKSG